MFTTADLPAALQATPGATHVCSHPGCPEATVSIPETAPGVPSRA